jgi:hypothetical protein
MDHSPGSGRNDTVPVRGHLRMLVNSPLTGAAVELVSKQTGHNTSSAVAMVRLLEPAGNYTTGTILYVGIDEFIAASSD